ncbi:hypothetical protein BPAE_0175g00020 [Botrytis paeoniae]|uniref:2EXR domain-containing protein n=1 Tax=Botrytis paeoniae TaxID=278948 RepID=A0A4Z1FG40_9HELO|nr:hypothetical protein BPAE_0175g00020 [Botrytis paeoniae]
MDGFNPPSWPPDNQNLTTPGAETADYEFGSPMEVDDHQQQSATSYYLPNQLPMGMTAEAYNQRQTGDTAPSNFQINRSQYLTTPWGNHLPHFSDSFGFAHGNTGIQGGSNQYTSNYFFNGYASPTFALPTSLRANPPLNTGSPRLAFTNQGGSSLYLDSRMTPSQSSIFNPLFNTFSTQLAFNNQGRSSYYPNFGMVPNRSANFNPPLQTPSTINGQLRTMENTAPLNPQFDQYGLPTESNPDYLPHDSGVFGFGSGQVDVQDDPGSNGNVGVYFDDDFKFATYPMLNACEPWVPDQRFYQFGNTDSFEDNHHSNQTATKQEWERVEGLPEYQNEFFGINSHTNALLTQESDEDPHSRDLLDKHGTSKSFSDLPLDIQETIWRYSFPAGRAAFIDFARYPGQIKLDERHTGLPITLAICKISRQVTMEHYTIVDRYTKGIKTGYMKPFCFNPEVDTLCISYNFIKQYTPEKFRNDWYDKVDKALKKKGALKDVGLKGVRFLDVRDVVTSLLVDTRFLPRVYKNSFLSRFENLDRLVFTSACAIDDRLLMPGAVALESLGECEFFWDQLAKYLENQKDSHRGKLVAKQKIIVREHKAPQDPQAWKIRRDGVKVLGFNALCLDNLERTPFGSSSDGDRRVSNSPESWIPCLNSLLRSSMPAINTQTTSETHSPPSNSKHPATPTKISENALANPHVFFPTVYTATVHEQNKPRA